VPAGEDLLAGHRLRLFLRKRLDIGEHRSREGLVVEDRDVFTIDRLGLRCELKVRAEHVEEHRGRKRLLQILVGACAEAGVRLEGLRSRAARGDDHRDGLQRFVFSDLGADRVARHARQLDAYDDGRGHVRFRQVEPALTVAGDRSLEPRAVQRLGELIREISLGIDDENARPHDFMARLLLLRVDVKPATSKPYKTFEAGERSSAHRGGETNELSRIDVGDERVEEIAILPGDHVVAPATPHIELPIADDPALEVVELGVARGIGEQRELRAAMVVHHVRSVAILDVREPRADEPHREIGLSDTGDRHRIAEVPLEETVHVFVAVHRADLGRKVARVPRDGLVVDARRTRGSAVAETREDHRGERGGDRTCVRERALFLLGSQLLRDAITERAGRSIFGGAHRGAEARLQLCLKPGLVLDALAARGAVLEVEIELDAIDRFDLLVETKLNETLGVAAVHPSGCATRRAPLIFHRARLGG
jgi:hypothetical protein